MTATIKTLTTGIIVLVLATMCFAKEWRGIAPLKSTRADVERLLGVPTDKSATSYYYRLPGELAVIWFQTEPCDQCGLGWNVPPETVTSIGIIPRLVYGKEKFIDVDKFKTVNANAGFIYYTNQVDGLTVETFNGKVTSLTYEPIETQANLRCPRKECIVDFFPKFDEYTNISWEDEKARLDNYAIQLKNLMGRGSIVVYGNGPVERERLIKRAKRARKHLEDHGIEPLRILIIDGGYREQSMFELNIHSIGGVMDRIYLYPEKDPKTKTKIDKRQNRKN